jgi:hypothetical protein
VNELLASLSIPADLQTKLWKAHMGHMLLPSTPGGCWAGADNHVFTSLFVMLIEIETQTEQGGVCLPQ